MLHASTICTDEGVAMRSLRRWLNRVLAYPAQAMMRSLSRQRPQELYEGIRLIVADEGLARHAESFFERTAASLRMAESRAARAFTEFRKDVEQVFLWGRPGAPAYNRFQLVVVVPHRIAFEAEIDCYAAWLLRASAHQYGKAEGDLRLQEFLTSLDRERREQVEAWLSTVA